MCSEFAPSANSSIELKPKTPRAVLKLAFTRLKSVQNALPLTRFITFGATSSLNLSNDLTLLPIASPESTKLTSGHTAFISGARCGKWVHPKITVSGRLFFSSSSHGRKTSAISFNAHGLPASFCSARSTRRLLPIFKTSTFAAYFLISSAVYARPTVAGVASRPMMPFKVLAAAGLIAGTTPTTGIEVKFRTGPKATVLAVLHAITIKSGA